MLILVAASDPELRAALADAVRAAGHTVCEAEDGARAWTTCLAAGPRLVVVDLGLAAGAGPAAADAWALCARIEDACRARLAAEDAEDGRPPADPASAAIDAGADDAAPETFVIVTVPRDGTADLQRALDAGAEDYLTTPPSPRNVAARLSIAERRMRQAAARRRAERALRRARWLAGVGETSMALQHEINNPLAALMGHVALIEEGLVRPDEEAETLHVVVEQAHRIASVMRRLAALRDPRSVEYFGGARMLDLSSDLASGVASDGPPERAHDGARDGARDPGDARDGAARGAPGGPAAGA